MHARTHASTHIRSVLLANFNNCYILFQGTLWNAFALGEPARRVGSGREEGQRGFVKVGGRGGGRAREGGREGGWVERK